MADSLTPTDTLFRGEIILKWLPFRMDQFLGADQRSLDSHSTWTSSWGQVTNGFDSVVSVEAVLIVDRKTGV
jgi:hypothetical protein